MLYAPPDQKLGLWDTWLFQDGEAYHLFHLQRGRREIGCSSIGHAVTRDWLHWETLPPVLNKGTGSSWDAGPLMTGMTFTHDGRYYLIYGAMVDQVQRIGLAVSDDLITWAKVGRDPILEPGGPWYETSPAQAINFETAWRDPYIFFHEPERCFYTFICARVRSGGDVGGGCIAVAHSADLHHWTLLPPAYVSDSITCLEVPEYFSLQERHYMTYTASYHFGTPYPVADAYQATGTFYLVSDEMLTGYRVPEHTNTLSAGMPNMVTNYVGRSIPVSGDKARRLYYYHHIYPPKKGESLYGSLSAPKYIAADAAGRLKITYAPGILESHVEDANIAQPPVAPDAALTLIRNDMPDGIVEAMVSVPYAGVCFRMGPGREEVLEGLAVWLAPSHQGDDRFRVILGTLYAADGPGGTRPVLGSPGALRNLERTYHTDCYDLRVMLRDAFVDVFVDDVLYLSHTFDPQTMPVAGGVGTFYAGKPKTDAVTQVSVRRFRT